MPPKRKQKAAPTAEPARKHPKTRAGQKAKDEEGAEEEPQPPKPKPLEKTRGKKKVAAKESNDENGTKGEAGQNVARNLESRKLERGTNALPKGVAQDENADDIPRLEREKAARKARIPRKNKSPARSKFDEAMPSQSRAERVQSRASAAPGATDRGSQATNGVRDKGKWKATYRRGDRGRPAKESRGNRKDAPTEPGAIRQTPGHKPGGFSRASRPLDHDEDERSDHAVDGGHSSRAKRSRRRTSSVASEGAFRAKPSRRREVSRNAGRAQAGPGGPDGHVMVPTAEHNPGDEHESSQEPQNASEDDGDFEAADALQEIMEQIPQGHLILNLLAPFDNEYGPNNDVLAVVVSLIQKHTIEANWINNARPFQDYINTPHLINEPWDRLDNPPPVLADRVQMNEKMAQDLTDIWASDTTAHSCRRYIGRALDKTHFDEDYDIRLCMRICLELIRENGSDDERRWAAAPQLENYFTAQFNTKDKWPLIFRQWNMAWTNQRESLADNSSTDESSSQPDDSSTEDHLSQFDNIHLAAKKLFLLESACVLPAFKPRNLSANRYLNRLKSQFVSRALYLLKPLWDEQVTSVPQEQQRALQREFGALDDNGVPYGVQEAVHRQSWRVIRDRMMARPLATTQPLAMILGRLQDFETMAMEHLNKYCEILHPPAWPADVAPETFIERLGQELGEQWRANLDKAWNSWIDEMQATGAKRAFKAQFKLVQKAIVNGELAWRPDESQPTDNENKAHREALGNVFGGERSGITGHWTQRQVLGQGGFGRAVLWVKYDPQLAIVDRIVLKDVSLKRERESSRDFDDAKYWAGRVDHRYPLEAFIPQKLRQAPDSVNILMCYSYAVFDRHLTYRVYTEFCPHGDLQEVIKSHHSMGLSTEPSRDYEGDRLDFLIPERVLWSIFEALTSAVCIMQCGCLPGDTVADDRRIDPVIHCDLKPLNVFLDAPDKDGFWPGIPLAKLGDFGLALVSSPNTQTFEAPGGTKGYEAPEQRRVVKPVVVLASDIWAIGRTMLSLVNLEVSPDSATPTAPNRNARSRYSKPLLKMIADCLERADSQRPGIEDLWQRVQDRVRTMERLRVPPLKMQARPDDEIQLGYQQDKHILWAHDKRSKKSS